MSGQVRKATAYKESNCPHSVSFLGAPNISFVASDTRSLALFPRVELPTPKTFEAAHFDEMCNTKILSTFYGNERCLRKTSTGTLRVTVGFAGNPSINQGF
jgi:hypothetical protein